MDDDTEGNDISLIRLLLAHKLEMSQEELAQTEQVLDLYIATLSRYITDTGAKLEISAIFPDKTIQFENVSTFLTAIEKQNELKPMTGKDIIALRQREGLSQSELARHMYLTPDSIEDWENNNKQIKGATLKLLNLIDKKGIEFLS